MAEDIPFEREDAAVPGRVEQLSPLIRRILCDNPGPFTFKGTVTYVVGTGRVAIIDPGPDDPRHVAAVLEAVKGETVEAILVTHTHRDHSPATPPSRPPPARRSMPRATPRRPPLNLGETNVLDASGDKDFVPDHRVKDGDVVTGTGWTLESVFTPGHTATTWPSPCGKSRRCSPATTSWPGRPPSRRRRRRLMGDYMASLDKLRGRDETLFWPGHGGAGEGAGEEFMRALAHHRRLREAAIMKRLGLGDRHIPDIVAAIYEGLDPRLKSAAGLSVFAHLEDLVGARAGGERRPGLADGCVPAGVTGSGVGGSKAPPDTLPSAEGRETTRLPLAGPFRLAQPFRWT